MPLIIPPAADGASVDRLTNVPGAECLHDPLGPMKIQTCWVPGQTQEADEAAALSFQIRDQVFVLHLEHRQGQHLQPVGGEPIGMDVEVAVFPQVESEKIADAKVLGANTGTQLVNN